MADDGVFVFRATRGEPAWKSALNKSTCDSDMVVEVQDTFGFKGTDPDCSDAPCQINWWRRDV